jgi:hypothetical protein
VIVNRPVIIQSNVDFAKKSDVQGSTSIPATVNFIRTAGYATQGDSGGALYKRSASEPSHGGKIQDSNNIWWELAVRPVHANMFGAVGDGVTDDTAAIQLALNYALPTGVDVHFSGTYLVTDTLTITGVSGSKPFRLIGENGNQTRMVFSNATSLKNMFTVGPETNYLRVHNIEFLDGSTLGTARISRCFYFSDTITDLTAPSWKHRFDDCRFFGFKEGVRFDGGATIADDAHESEVMFMHSKFRNCEKGLIYNNIQAVNHQLIGCDFENDHADDEAGKWQHIVFERGSFVNHVGGSVIGYGPYVHFEYATASEFQATSQFTSRGVRIEARGDGPFIEHDTDSTITVSNAFRLHFEDMAVVVSEETTPVLAQFGGRVYARFENVHANVDMDINAYITTNLASNAQYGKIEIENCKALNYVRVSGTTAYGSAGVAASNRRSIPAEISRQGEGTVGDADGDGYFVLTADRQTIYTGNWQVAQMKTLVYNAVDTAGLGSGSTPVSALGTLPLYARPCKFRLLRDDRNAGSAFQLDLVFVVGGVDTTVATITPTSNAGGHFEANITHASVLTDWIVDGTTWDGRIKVTKSGTINGYVGLIMIDYM